jgi:hypothetical protein|tara:strand:- start:223 stop:732 length:510 start_codon:yes stop_codon:yes gene_type:complete
MQSIKIKGKDYIQVHERVAELRRNPLYKTLTIETEIVEKNYSELTGDILKHKKDAKGETINPIDYKLSKKVGVKVSKVLDSIIIKCVIRNKDGNVVSTGYAQEEKATGFVNETSFVENCETSAVGRALGFLGIGIKDSIASADELVVAISKQKKSTTQSKKKVEHINQI